MTQYPFRCLPDGVIEFEGADFIERYYPWNHAGGFRVEGAERDCYGYLRPSCLLHILEGITPFRALHGSIPRSVIRRVNGFKEGHYDLIRLAAKHEIEAIRLMVMNPLLALALSRHPDDETAQEMVLRPWRDIVRWLGFEAGHSMARILSKMQPELQICQTLSEFPRLGPRREKMLSYLPAITVDVWVMIFTLPDAALSVEQLRYAAGNRRGTHYCNAIETIIMFRKALNRRAIWPYPPLPLQQLQDRVAPLRREAQQCGAVPQTVFPPPPFTDTGNYWAVLDSGDLSYVALKFECCVENYSQFLENGSAAIYWDERGADPHVVLLTCSKDIWRVDQVRGPSNTPVHGVTEMAVRALFHGRKSTPTELKNDEKKK